MGEVTAISWTDHTFNPWIGCTKISPGCDHCYAETLNHRWGADNWGKGKPRRVMADAYWRQPLKWNRDAEKKGRTHLVFCASMADVMDDEAPEGEREKLWKLIDATPNLLWQLLTKRPHRYSRYLPEKFAHNNLWLGITAENQEFYKVRWPILRDECKRRKLLSWISYEPALGGIWMGEVDGYPHWVIFGGESGNGRRECKEGWARSIRSECYENGVKFFMKQMGGRTPTEGKAAIPSHLQIQEFPGAAVRGLERRG